jgi:hypothetical protein
VVIGRERKIDERRERYDMVSGGEMGRRGMENERKGGGGRSIGERELQGGPTTVTFLSPRFSLTLLSPTLSLSQTEENNK